MSFGVLMYSPSEHIEECKSAEQNVADVPSGDLISRADAIEAVCGAVMHEFDVSTNCGYEVAETALSALPSADRQQVNSNSAEEQIAETCDRPKGEWIDNAYINTEKSWFICSECGNSVFHKSNYCPRCGADMRPEK